MMGGYSGIGIINPPQTNSSFCHTQYTGATSSSQNAVKPMMTSSAVRRTAAANPNAAISASTRNGGIQPVKANAHRNATTPSTGARAATTPTPSANIAP